MRKRPAKANLRRLVGVVAAPALIAFAARLGPAAAQDVTSISPSVSVSHSTSPVILASWLQPHARRAGASLDLTIASYVKYQEMLDSELPHEQVNVAYCTREFEGGPVLCSDPAPVNAVVATGQTIPAIHATFGLSR